MTITLSKRDLAHLNAALFAATEYERSLADAWARADTKVAARSRRRVKTYRRIRAAICNQVQLGP